MERIYIYDQNGLIEAIEGETEDAAYNKAKKTYDLNETEWTFDLSDVPGSED